MTRRKGILKILIVALAVLLLAVVFAGCGEYKPPENTGVNTPVVPVPDNPVKPDNPDGGQEEYFTVTLTNYDGSSFTSASYPLITELQAQWTEVTDGNNRAQVYRAGFDENGVARINFINSEFKVTLVTTESFCKSYTYDPNNDASVVWKGNQDINVRLYRLKQFAGGGSMVNSNGERVDYITLEDTGAYSYTLESIDDKQMFFYIPQMTGEYSFLTLVDVTADEIDPIVDLHNGQAGSYLNAYGITQEDGGAEGRYTKNVVLKYQISEDMKPGESGNCLMFNLYSRSEKPDAYPLTVNFILERDGEYTRPVEESTPVPVTENFANTPKTPEGTFRFLGATVPTKGNVHPNTRHILDESSVKLNEDDGYYYFIDESADDFYRDEDGEIDGQFRVYVMLTDSNPVHDMFTHSLLARGLYWVTDYKTGALKNYYDFIVGTNGYASHVNLNGAYPVNKELRNFLQDYAVSQRLFNDGNGYAEWPAPDGPAYNSDEDSQWMYACGVYS
ncbi:MAG: hypothetical protein NC131_03655 [Roseburia sp.]|nr:hypothetical protein [Roseburia sp.]